MGLEQQREIPYQEAAASWYDSVYLPAVEIIRRRGMLRDFPNRTETDLYLWIAEHHAALQEWLGWEIEPETAAADLETHHSPTSVRRVARWGERLLTAVTPDELRAGPPPGTWRGEATDRLFFDILVALDGSEGGWIALEQALLIAQREGARLQGLHVVADESELENEQTGEIQARFDWRCGELGVTGRLAVRVGEAAHEICDGARWAHLVVAHLAHPPAPHRLARLSSGFRTLVRRCPRPILAVPGNPSPLNKILLAYDGSPKAREALYIAAYAACRWGTDLIGVTVDEKGDGSSDTVNMALAYLNSRGVHVLWESTEGPVAPAILTVALEQDVDLLMMGGYGASPLVEVVLGSVVDKVLRESTRPILVCR
jgi:nucleotide-binding universal stress UspA family protein